MPFDIERAFKDWKADAQEADILAEALKRGARLRRVGGKEWIGPCPLCGGKDRFSVNTVKRVFNCRGFGGGDVIGMVMHISQVDFLSACELLTGREPPRGKGKPLSDEEKQEQKQRRDEYERAALQREADSEAYMARRAGDAEKLWGERSPIAGTLAERYLHSRGIPTPPFGWDPEIAYHPGLVYELDPAPWRQKPIFPCLIGRVLDVVGDMIALHRIYLDPKTGQKIDREESKVTMGSSVGGAVRLGGLASEIAACEGLETALGILWLTSFRRPVWATLGTAGLAGFEVPFEVGSVTVYPDGDPPMRRNGNEHVPEINPPGRRAARDLRERILPAGIRCGIAPEPDGSDYLDVWLRASKSAELTG